MERGHLLSSIAAAVGGTLHGPDLRIMDISIDTRRSFAVDSTLFVALVGKHHDAHRYVPQLVQRGVRAFMVQGTPVADASCIVVDNTLVALQRSAAWHRAQFHVPVIGITGSNGKTVVKEWLFQLLREEEYVVRSPGSWNSQVGVPLSVWGMGPEHTLGIFEAGISEPGEMQRIAQVIAPTIGLFTNVGPAHAEHFISDQRKVGEKALLFAKANSVVYCRDHALVHDALLLHGIKELCDWSREQDAFVRVKSEEITGSCTRIALVHQGNEFIVEAPFTDKASLENVLHCVTMLRHLGRTAEWLAEHIPHLQPVAMRLELLAAVHDGTLINDTYSNDLASLTIALEHLSLTGTDRPRVVVVSDIAESNEAPAKLYARIADMLRQAHVARVIGVGPIIAEHAQAFEEGTLFFADAETLLRALATPPIDGAVTLVKGARRFGLERVVQRWEQHTHGTVMEVDLHAIRHNLNHYRELCGPRVKVMAMVKAGGYGSGAVELARLFAHEQVAYLGVAYADEGIELRRNGIHTPVLVMNPEPVALDVLHRFNLEAEVYDQRSLRAAIDFAQHVTDAPSVHIKVDTGMHRLGFMPHELDGLLGTLRNAGRLRVASILSHFAASEDPQQDDATRDQLALFTSMADSICAALGHQPLRHIANSAGATRFPEARLDMVRLGIGLHGIGVNPSENAQLLPTDTLRTVIAQIKDIPVGGTVSYGRHFRAERPTRIAVLPIGYADGLSRRLGNGQGRVWIHGKPAFFVGSICMDMCMVDITAVPCALGDDAFLFSAAHPLAAYAEDLGTIPYEALTSISPRVKRMFVHS